MLDQYVVRVTQEHFKTADSLASNADARYYISNTCPLAIALAEQIDDSTIAWWVEDSGSVYAKRRLEGVDLIDCPEIARYESGPSGLFVINYYDIVKNNDLFNEAIVTLTRVE